MADYITEIAPKERKESYDSFMRGSTRDLKILEGFSPKTKVPTPGDKPTIGHGHTGPRAVAGAEITREDAESLLQTDITRRLPAIKALTPRYEDLDEATQRAIMSAYYRGSWGGSPKTREHFNAGRFSEAADEFLDNDEYRAAVARGRAGIRPRMEAVAAQLRNARYREPIKEPQGMEVVPGMVTGRAPQRR